ncbi:MAG: hypothetical protein GIW97_01840, partial [Candidatus Eremiobacteraeota bacterium]|nr:hypothetical protein [Candidatus Eremiobacteraeota bacterium]
MRTWLSLIVIAFSLVALGSGYLSGRSSVTPAQTVAAPPPVPVDAHNDAQVQFARSLHGAHSFAASEDAPVAASEEAVVSNSPLSGRLGDDATVAAAAFDRGKTVYILLAMSPSQTQ